MADKSSLHEMENFVSHLTKILGLVLCQENMKSHCET